MKIELFSEGSYDGVWHCDQTTIWLLLRGTGTVRISGVSYSVQSGDAVVLPENLQMEYHLQSRGLLGRIRISRRNSGLYSPVLHAAGNEMLRKTFTYILEMNYLLEDEVSVESPAVLTVEQTLETLFWQVMVQAMGKETSGDPVVCGLILTIQQNLENSDFDVQKAMEDTGYSPGHIRRIFHEEVGVSPGRFLSNLRVEKAKMEIMTGGESRSLKEIALSCGFADQYTFTKQFRNREGMTPTAFQKSVSTAEKQNISEH